MDAINRIKKRKALAAVLVLIVFTSLFFSFQKSGLFIDETYTYGLSNGYYTPFVKDVLGGEIKEEILSKEQIFEYLTVNEEDSFALDSVYYNQTQDVHPPLHYMLLHIVSSLTPGQFSMWTGLILNLVIFILTLITLYALANKILKNQYISVLVVLLYGLSRGGQSTYLMIRMYMLLTLFTVVLAYLIAGQIDTPKLRGYIGIAAVIFAGMFTQYYFVFYAFFVCAAYTVYTLFAKKYKSMLAFMISAFSGIVLFLISYPAVFQHLFADKLVSGKNALENLGGIGQYIGRIKVYGKQILKDMFVPILIGIAAAIVLIALFFVFRKNKERIKKDRCVFAEICIIVLPAFVTFLIVTIISPVLKLRYVYNILPIFALLVGYVLNLIALMLKVNSKRKHAFGVIAMCIVMLAYLWCVPPDYLYLKHVDYNTIVEEYDDNPCVFFAGNYNAPITGSMLQLIRFDEVYITDDPKSEKLGQYLDNHKNAEQVVLYIDVDEFWSSGFNAEEKLNEFIENNGYSQYIPLYTSGISETYLVT